MTEEELVAALDETRALGLAILEKLSEKSGVGSFAPFFSKEDVTSVLKKQVKMVERFRREREERARGLVLPPGARE